MLRKVDCLRVSNILEDSHVSNYGTASVFYIWRHCTKNHVSQVLEYHGRLKNTKYMSSVHHLFGSEKDCISISKNFKTRTFQQSLNTIFQSTFYLKKDRISHLPKVQNKNFSLISKRQIFIKFLAQKRLYFLSPKSQKKNF